MRLLEQSGGPVFWKHICKVPRGGYLELRMSSSVVTSDSGFCTPALVIAFTVKHCFALPLSRSQVSHNDAALGKLQVTLSLLEREHAFKQV